MKTLEQTGSRASGKRTSRVEDSQRWSRGFEVGRVKGRSKRSSTGKGKLDRVDRILLYDSASLTFVPQSSPKVNCNEQKYRLQFKL